MLNFAVVAETAGYDCHASQTFALLHPKGWTMSPSHFQGTHLAEVWLDE
jgi:hypothetical protein